MQTTVPIHLLSSVGNITNFDNCTLSYPKSLCNFGKFLWNFSLLLNALLLLPQLYKLHRKKRYQNIANGISLFWLSLICCAQAGNWRWLMTGQQVVNSNFAIVMEVWLFCCGLTLLCYTLALAETHFDYQRPLTLGLTLLGCTLVLTVSCVGSKNAAAMRGLANFMSVLQIYPQLLLSELLGTSKAVSVWTVFLMFIKYLCFYIGQYIIYLSTEEYIFAYMTTCMFLVAVYHCFAYPGHPRTLPGSNDISRSQFTVLAPSRSAATNTSVNIDSRSTPNTAQPNNATGGGVDSFFSIDDFDNTDIDNTPVNLPTVTPRQDGRRTTIACLNWYSMSIVIGVTALLLTASLVWKVMKFSVVLAPLCVILLVVSVFSFRYFLPERILTTIKFIL